MFHKQNETAASQPANKKSSLPDLHTQIYTDSLPAFSDPNSLAAFARVSRLYHDCLQPTLNKIKLQKLLTHVIRGEQTEAKKLLESLPKKDLTVLLKRGKVTDHSNRTIEGTAFQLALGAEDVKFYYDEECTEECMAEMLAGYIRMLPEGDARLAEQYQEQFPDGWETQEAKRASQDSAALDLLLSEITEITEDDCKAVNAADDKIQALICANQLELKTMNDAALNATQNCFDEAFNALTNYLSETFNVDALKLKALYQFRNYLERSTHEVIKNGKHFNVQLLVNAFALYKKNYGLFGNDSESAKNLLCWRKVIGYAHRFLPACYAQAFSRGRRDFAEVCKSRSERSAHSSEDYVCLLRRHSMFRLDFGFAAGELVRVCAIQVAVALSDYAQRKHYHCSSFAVPRLAAEESVHCKYS